jgi:hypothetical protein
MYAMKPRAIVFLREVSWRPVSDMTVHFVVDLCLLISC